MGITGPGGSVSSTMERLARTAFETEDVPKDWDLVSRSSRGRVYRIPSSEGHGPVYLKLFEPHGRRRLRTLFYRSDPAQEAWSLDFLARLDIPTPRVLGVGEERSLGMAVRGWLATEEVTDSMPLISYLEAQDWRSDISLRALHRALRRLGEHVGHFHKAGFVDGDLHLRNVLVHPVSQSKRLGFVFFDHPRSRMMKRQSAARYRRRVHDLACLDKDADAYLTPWERARVFVSYVRALGQELDRRQLMSDIANRKQHLISKRKVPGNVRSDGLVATRPDA